MSLRRNACVSSVHLNNVAPAGPSTFTVVRSANVAVSQAPLNVETHIIKGITRLYQSIISNVSCYLDIVNIC